MTSLQSVSTVAIAFILNWLCIITSMRYIFWVNKMQYNDVHTIQYHTILFYTIRYYTTILFYTILTILTILYFAACRKGIVDHDAINSQRKIPQMGFLRILLLGNRWVWMRIWRHTAVLHTDYLSFPALPSSTMTHLSPSYASNSQKLLT